MSKTETELMKSAVRDLLMQGAIIKCKPCPFQFISPTFLADKSGGGKRFILNLKKLNEFVDSPHFKMEDLRTAIRLTHKNVYMTTIDLKDAYFLISVDIRDRKYLRFTFEGQLYEFTCLPFGLSAAPFCFTKIMKPILSHLRSKNITMVNYLDDFLIFGESFDICLFHTKLVLEFLQSLGFIINDNKSRLTPSTNTKFLGFLIDSVNLKLELPVEKKKSGYVVYPHNF